MIHFPAWMRTRVGLLLIAGAVLSGAGLTAYGVHELREEHLVRVHRHLLYRSVQPTQEMLEEDLSRHHIAVVIDLRPRKEDPAMFDYEEAICRQQGIRFVNVPIGVTPTDEQLASFLEAARPRRGAVLVHCAQGKMRAGIMVASYRVLVDGWSAGRAMRELRRYAPKDDGYHGKRLAFLKQLQAHRPERAKEPGPATCPASSPAAP